MNSNAGREVSAIGVIERIGLKDSIFKMEVQMVRRKSQLRISQTMIAVKILAQSIN